MHEWAGRAMRPDTERTTATSAPGRTARRSTPAGSTPAGSAAAGPDLGTLLQRTSTEQSWTGAAPATRIRRKADGDAPATAPVPLPGALRSGIEALSGFALDDVRVHYNSPQPAQLQALAYTQGTDIHVAPGQERHLAHEAWHVVQQKQGRVQPTLHLNSTNDDPALEREADQMGAQAERGGAAPPAS